ncbi:MAG: carboxylating nicotinate-nucleotide diphosphorylase [Puniceicoccales bacterium]
MSKSCIDDFSRRLRWDEIDPAWVRRLVELAREEDLAGGGLLERAEHDGDASTESVIQGGEGRARLVARKQMVVAGLPIVQCVFDVYESLGSVTLCPGRADSDLVQAGETIAELQGARAAIITAERVLLNFLQRLSGVATATRLYVDALGGSSTRLLDTRKTTPGYRMLEKYAVACGGGWNHRLGLYDRIMLKDNHLAAAGATTGARLAAAVRTARERRPDLGIEVEVDALEQIPPVLDAGADVIMLDNFSNERLVEAISLIGDDALTEASGGITLERLPSLAGLGLDFISTGATVHQAPWVDIGLDWE